VINQGLEKPLAILSVFIAQEFDGNIVKRDIIKIIKKLNFLISPLLLLINIVL